MEQLGGRKFVGFVILVLAGGLVDVFNPNGLSTTLAGMFAALYATFSAANTVLSTKGMQLPEAPAVAVGPSADELSAVTMQVEGVLRQIAVDTTNLKKSQSEMEQAVSTLQEASSIQQKALESLLSRK